MNRKYFSICLDVWWDIHVGRCYIVIDFSTEKSGPAEDFINLVTAGLARTHLPPLVGNYTGVIMGYVILNFVSYVYGGGGGKVSTACS